MLTSARDRERLTIKKGEKMKKLQRKETGKVTKSERVRETESNNE